MESEREDRAMSGERLYSRRGFLEFSAVAAGALAVSACVPEVVQAPAPAPAAGPKRGGQLTLLSGDGVITLDPYFFTNGARELSQQIHDSLVSFNGPDPLVPQGQLAESWQETETTLTLKLRRGVKFHNGREFTAQDVADSMARAKDKSIGHQQFSVFDPTVESVDVIDPYTARISYRKLNPIKFAELAQLWILPKENWGDITKHPIGAGPFKFVRHVPGLEVELERFDEYWQKDQPYLDKITVKIMTDPQARVANMTAGTGDVMPNPPRVDFDRLSREPNLQAVAAEVVDLWDDIILNCSKKPLDNKLVRQALNYTVDRAKFNKLVYFGQLVESQSVFQPNHWAYDPKVAQLYTFDLDKAKALLRQAGYPDGFDTSININSANPQYAQYSEIWAQDLAKVGVRLKIRVLEGAVSADEYNKGLFEMQAFNTGLIGRGDPAALTASSPYRPEGNRANIENQPFFEEYKRLWAEGLTSIDRKVRKPIYDRLQEIIAGEGFIIVLGFTPNRWILSKRVRGFRAVPSGLQVYAPVWLDK